MLMYVSSSTWYLLANTSSSLIREKSWSTCFFFNLWPDYYCLSPWQCTCSEPSASPLPCLHPEPLEGRSINLSSNLSCLIQNPIFPAYLYLDHPLWLFNHVRAEHRLEDWRSCHQDQFVNPKCKSLTFFWKQLACCENLLEPDLLVFAADGEVAAGLVLHDGLEVAQQRLHAAHPHLKKITPWKKLLPTLHLGKNVISPC